jgi:hypothetical protein
MNAPQEICLLNGSLLNSINTKQYNTVTERQRQKPVTAAKQDYHKTVQLFSVSILGQQNSANFTERHFKIFVPAD